MKILSSGERIEVPFNITISVVQGETSTIVGRESLPGISENTAINIRSAITVPSGKWTLLIEVDPEQEIWELSEMNNMWSANYSEQSDGISGTVIAIAGGGGLLLIVGLATVLVRKRREGAEVETATPVKKPLKGPPPRKDEAKKAPSNLKGPPPKIPDPTPETELPSDAEVAVAPSGTPDVGETVTDYSQLPGGGEYQYEGSQTFYAGSTIGRWMQNPDQSFTRIQ